MTSFCENHSIAHSILSISPTYNFLFLPYLFIAKHLIIGVVPQNMYTLNPFYQFCDCCIYFKETNMVSGDTILKWEMFVWILSHVPSAIALSLFILKSSNLDIIINDASYPNLKLIAYKLKLVLVPCATSEWPKVLCSFFLTVYYVQYALPTCSPWLPISSFS